MARVLGVGLIGCGNISTTYLDLAPLFGGIEFRAVADLNPEIARASAEKFDLRADSIEELLNADDIDIIVNLTVPDAHFTVTKQILEAGKHAYSEKPLAVSLTDGQALKALAGRKNRTLACAPDTFLGGAHQLARAHIDSGAIGRITSGTCHVMSHGMEMWHPNPNFFFQPGGGPVLDLGPYYIANLINLIGPVKRVAALTSIATSTRKITSELQDGQIIQVNTPTNIHALLEFEQGATITLTASWDVWAHQHNNMELYGTKGTIIVPDPNHFGGEVSVAGIDGEISLLADWQHPFGRPNQGDRANYRAAGLAEMANAILQSKSPRCSLDRTLHGVDVMLAILKSGKTGGFIDMQTTCTRPDALGIDAANALLK